MKLKFLFSFIFLFSSLVSLSQNVKKIYIDEDLKEMNLVTYIAKCKYKTNKCVEYKTDSLAIYKVLKKFSFNKLSAKNYEQIRLLLNQDSNIKIDSGETIILKNFDSIYSYSSAKKKHDNHAKTHISTLNGKPLHHNNYNKKTYERNEKTHIRNIRKCTQKFEKLNNIKVLYTFSNSELSNSKNSKLNIIKARSIIKSTFFKILYQYDTLILKPNGEYFLSGGHLNDKLVKKIVLTKNWTTLKNDWKDSREKYPITGSGLFKFDKSHSKHCF
ncbi:hypothetical protein [uncultured Lacinutrix sp.]|uniref:hypothetical protein n=1 Tax=uncultured Lacinutrix sp. TaxID=574032 RepID=UPI0026085B3F|nr:hypothetical protein [uncultured Lacinutrix sp.]